MKVPVEGRLVFSDIALRVNAALAGLGLAYPPRIRKAAPGDKHWNGATATMAMTHSAIVDAPDGRAVEWMEKVTDEQYFASARTN